MVKGHLKCLLASVVLASASSVLSAEWRCPGPDCPSRNESSKRDASDKADRREETKKDREKRRQQEKKADREKPTRSKESREIDVTRPK